MANRLPGFRHMLPCDCQGGSGHLLWRGPPARREQFKADRLAGRCVQAFVMPEKILGSVRVWVCFLTAKGPVSRTRSFCSDCRDFSVSAAACSQPGGAASRTGLPLLRHQAMEITYFRKTGNHLTGPGWNKWPGHPHSSSRACPGAAQKFGPD